MAQVVVTEAQTRRGLGRRRGAGRRPRRGGGKAYLYLLPTILVLFLFVYYPIIESFRLSLNRVAPFGSDEIFIWFEHYGDLLTSSSRAGHAMRADDPERAFGAVIGKAMTPLADGDGLVLVLVNLQ